MDAQWEPTGTHALWDETFQKLGALLRLKGRMRVCPTISAG